MARYEVHRTDGNAKEIIAALRKMGASVEQIDRPLDVLIGFRGVNIIAEIKTTRGKIRASQKAFMDGWRGSFAVLRSVDDARALLATMGKQVEWMEPF